MQILHLSTYDSNQGAARAAYRLHRSLLSSGEQSLMRVASAQSRDHTVISPRSKPRQALALLRSTASWWLSKPQISANPTTHSVSCLPSSLHNEVNRSDADVVHLHWLQDEFISVESIGRIRKPLVWTLHDTWPFCGSEHYPIDHIDIRFILGYHKYTRHKLDKGFDLDRFTWNRKQRSWESILSRLHIVAPSSWIAELARTSKLFSSVPCHIIPNAVPLTFRPIPKLQARSLLGLCPESPLLLFGSLSSLSDTRKGFDLLSSALRLLPQPLRAMALILGEMEPKNPSLLPIPCRYLGHIHDDITLSLVYSAVDLVVVPSRLDNLPQSVTEAIACGTPVVAFRQGGMPDILTHKVNGWLADCNSPASLATGITWCLSNLPSPIYSPIVETWRPNSVSENHSSLYRKILAT